MRLYLLQALFLPLLLVAQAPSSAPVKIIGTVESIDASNGKAQVKTDAGVTWSVTMTDQTTVVRVPPGEKDLKKATKIKPVDVAPGDRLLARGPAGTEPNSLTASALIVMTKADIAQMQAHDQAEWARRGIGGIVTAVDPATSQVTVNVRSAGALHPMVIQAGPNTVVRRYAPNSVRFADAKPSTIAEISPGDQVRALGDRSEDGTHFTAEEIVSGSFRTIAGTVVSTDPAANTVTLQNLENKQKVTVHVNGDTLMRTIPEQIATMMAMRLRGGSPGSSPQAGGGGWQRPAGAPASGGAAPASSQAAGNQGAGGLGAPGSRGHMDLQQMLERMPPLQLSELKKGDALIISSTVSADPSDITAINLVAGVEPFLAAAPRTAGGQINLGNWNLDMGGGMPGE